MNCAAAPYPPPPSPVQAEFPSAVVKAPLLLAIAMQVPDELMNTIEIGRLHVRTGRSSSAREVVRERLDDGLKPTCDIEKSKYWSE